MPALPDPKNHTAGAIDAAMVARARNGDSAGVPMSAAVHECDRHIWLGLRWASPPEQATGAKQRIFRAGHQYEAWLLDDLRAIGCEVQEIDEATGKQIKVELAAGHVRGKVDGMATGIPEAPKAVHVVECKSHNRKNFDQLVKHKVQKAKPEHYAQCQLYMHGTGVHRALYIAECKDDGRQHIERLHYDPAFCVALESRLDRIIFSPRPPERNEGHWCEWCRHKANCLDGQFPRTNCRTCLHASPHDGPLWSCARWDRIGLTYDEMQAGCGAHLFIPDIVPGEQIDADEERGTVTYSLADGRQWTDGEGRA